MEPSYPPECPGPVRELRSRLTGRNVGKRGALRRGSAQSRWTRNRFNLFGSASPFRGAYLQSEYTAIPVPLHFSCTTLGRPRLRFSKIWACVFWYCWE